MRTHRIIAGIINIVIALIMIFTDINPSREFIIITILLIGFLQIESGIDA